MKKILICPAERPAVAFLSQFAPLANLPLLGETVLGYWMEHLARSDVKAALILATDRPDQVREAVQGGTRWGVNIEVISELQELSPESAYERYRSQDLGKGLRDPGDAVLIDHLPNRPEQRLFASYARWFEALLARLEGGSPALNRVGAREVSRGVWVGRRTHIDETAVLRAPCWIGENVRVGPNVLIGPRAVLEDRVVVESASEVMDSSIGPDTFVGALTKVQDSLAWGSTLINWQTGSCTQIPDPFLMCPLGSSHLFASGHATTRWTEAWRTALSKPFEFLQAKAKLR